MVGANGGKNVGRSVSGGLRQPQHGSLRDRTAPKKHWLRWTAPAPPPPRGCRDTTDCAGGPARVGHLQSRPGTDQPATGDCTGIAGLAPGLTAGPGIVQVAAP